MTKKKDEPKKGLSTLPPEDAPKKPLSEKDKAIQLAITAVEKQFGRGTIMDMGKTTREEVPVIPSGSWGLDRALGIGGYPRGRMIEVFGPEASGKTTLTLHMIAEAQKTGGRALFVDAEHALDPDYAENVGVRMDELLLTQPDYGEQALEIVDLMVRSGGFDIVIVDSVAALVPKAELEGDMGDTHVGLQARMMSQAMRKLASVASQHKTAIVFINQLRKKIGVMFGNPETTTGGEALKFYSSVRLDIRKIGTIKRRDEVIGSQVRVKVVKNKLFPPFKTAEFDIIWGKGVNRVGEVFDLACQFDIIEKRGSHYKFGTDALGQGRDNVCAALQEEPDMLEQIEKSVKEKLEE